MALELAVNFSEASGNVIDYSGNGRDFAITGNTVRTAAGSGYTYGGTVPTRKGLTQTANDIAVGPTVTPFNTTSRTIECWAKAPGADPSWFGELYNASNDTGAWGWLSLSGVFSFRAKNAANTAFARTLTADTVNYHHFAATHDGTTLKVYRDGTQVGADISLPSTIMTGSEFRLFDQSGSACVISDLRIYSHVLSSAQINTDMATPVTAQTPGFVGWGVPL